MQSPLEWLVIAHGEPLPAEQLRKLAENKAVLVLDGALQTVLQRGIQPQIVLGDFDSIPPDVKKAEAQSFVWLHQSDQETTDLEKALQYLDNIKASSVTITHAVGWRLDHSLHNLRLLKRFHQAFKSLVLMTALEQVFYLENQAVTLKADDPQPLAVLAFTEAEVSSRGLQYEMQSLPLQFAVQESISNYLQALAGEIVVKGGVLLLCSHDTRVSVR